MADHSSDAPGAPAKEMAELNISSPIQAATNSGPRSPPPNVKTSSSPHSGHRSSFAENMRGLAPHSPRPSRQQSLTQQALQELLNNPPTMGSDDEFRGRDWKTIRIGEIVDEKQVQFASYDTSVEEATELLGKSGSPNVVLLSEDPSSHAATGTFDYGDLNAYLLLVVGLAHPTESETASFDELAKKGREGKPVPLRDIRQLGNKEPLITLPHTADLTKAMEVFGSGVHRILVAEEGKTEIVGVLTQLRLVQFFWENRKSFPVLDGLYQQQIKDLQIGAPTVMAINGDKPLTDALQLLNDEGISSLPVLDVQNNVIGNISQVDVRLLIKSTSAPLLSSSCIHFISVILSERGVNDGQDSFPVFHINPWSTLAHTVAKLVATRSHRMWVVDTPSPATSGPPTPAATPAPMSMPSVLVPPSPISPNSSGNTPLATTLSPTPGPMGAVAPAISAAAVPGASMSGRLSGVISLTDILNLFARVYGLHPHDPDQARRARRRSSSSSVRKSMDSSRSESISSMSVRRGSVTSDRNAQGLGIARGRGV